MKKFMLVIFDRYDVSKSSSVLFESELSDLKDVLISKMCEIWEVSVKDFDKDRVRVGEYVGVDFEEESYLLIKL